MKISDIYQQIVANASNWNSTKSTSIECEYPKVMYYPHSYNFLIENLFYDGNLRELAFVFFKYQDKIPQYRFTHTVSLYLMGIYVAEIIGYENFHLGEWDKEQRRNFLHHWAAVCLFHDIGYAMEEQPDAYSLEECKSLDDLVRQLNITTDLSKLACYELIDNYFKYRASNGKTDHGITAAILLYDSLVRRNAEMEKMANSGTVIISEKPLFGDEYLSDVSQYASEIAQHNMWFTDTVEKCETYIRYKLDDLIAKEDMSHRRSFLCNPMLFLLCLLDTIEPTKAFPNLDPKEALEQCGMTISKTGECIELAFDNTTLISKAKGCQNWLDIEIAEDMKIRFLVH